MANSPVWSVTSRNIQEKNRRPRSQSQHKRTESILLLLSPLCTQGRSTELQEWGGRACRLCVPAGLPSRQPLPTSAPDQGLHSDRNLLASLALSTETLILPGCQQRTDKLGNVWISKGGSGQLSLQSPVERGFALIREKDRPLWGEVTLPWAGGLRVGQIRGSRILQGDRRMGWSSNRVCLSLREGLKGLR